MRPLFIAIISLQKENFNKAEELLEEKYFDFSYFSALEDFQKEKDEKEFDVIVIDDKTFDKNIDNEFINDLIVDENVVLYSLIAQYANKKGFFEKGGWMAAVGKLADERLLFFLNQMLQFENHLIPAIRKKNLFVGDIVNFSLKELLMSAFMEKKSFEIFIISEKQHGKIFIQNGALMEASWGQSKNIEAIVRMFFLQNGKIRVVPPRRNFKITHNLPTLMGIIHEFEFQKQMISEWLQEKNKLSINNAKISWNAKAQYVFKNHHEKTLSEKLTAGLSIEAVITAINVMPVKALEILHHFEDAGNLIISAIKDVTDEQAGSMQIENKELWIKEKFNLEDDVKSARLLVLGHKASGKSQFISMLEGKGIQKKSVRNLESLRLEINREFKLNILGLSLEQDVMQAIEVIGNKISAYIFFIDATLPENFEYINYLINLFLNKFQIPSVIILTHTQHFDETAVNLIKNKFSFPREIKFITTNIEKLKDPWYLIDEIELIENERKTSEVNKEETDND